MGGCQSCGTPGGARQRGPRAARAGRCLCRGPAAPAATPPARLGFGQRAATRDAGALCPRRRQIVARSFDTGAAELCGFSLPDYCPRTVVLETMTTRLLVAAAMVCGLGSGVWAQEHAPTPQTPNLSPAATHSGFG